MCATSIQIFTIAERACESKLFRHQKCSMCIVGSLLIFKAINNFLYSSQLNILILHHFFLSTHKYMLLPVHYRRITLLFLLLLISCSVKNKTLLLSCSTQSSITLTHDSNLRIHILTRCILVY